MERTHATSKNRRGDGTLVQSGLFKSKGFVMKKALEILEDIRETKWCGVKPTCQNFTIADFDKAIAEIKAFKKECEKLVIESQKLVNETLDLGGIIIKQRQRIAELEETLSPKTCEGCKLQEADGQACSILTYAVFECGAVMPNNFYCCLHEIKDNACDK